MGKRTRRAERMARAEIRRGRATLGGSDRASRRDFGESGATGAYGTREGREMVVVLDSLRDLAERRDDVLASLEAEQDVLVEAARTLGLSWERIGGSLDLTGEGLRRRYLSRQASRGSI